MNRNRHYKKLFLSVFVLILPSLLVALLGWNYIVLANEKRLEEENKAEATTLDSARTEIGKLVRDRLESIKSQGIDNGGGFDDDAVKFAVWVDDERIVTPWEKDPNARHYNLTINEPVFLVGKEEAKRAEYEKPLDRAIGLYRGLVQSAGTEGQRAYARLKLAEVLRRSGYLAEAVEEYQKLLSVPSNVVNEDGDSFASIAAGGLLDTAPLAVVNRFERDMESPAALTLDQTRRWSEILEMVPATGDAALGADKTKAMKKVSERIEKIEQMEKILEQDPDLLALRQSLPKALSDRTWMPYGANLLISRSPAGASPRLLLIAVQRERIFESVRSSLGSTTLFQIAVGGDKGEPLDEQRLPGLKVILPRRGDVTTPRGYVKRTFFAGLMLVVTLNLFGGYLLWRDTRRETRLSELRSQFVSSVSHELKTPLTSIRMFAEILQMGSAPDTRSRDECLNTIVNESERLTRLLNNVLDFSRIEQGQKTYQMASTQLSDVVKDAVKTMQYPLAEQGFDLHLNVDEQIPAVNADRDALKQAVLNLLTNAMKYSGKSRDIELRLFPRNGDAMIQVQDHGIGISERDQLRIFERFFRAQIAEDLSISGTGLGLALVAHIAEAHGGGVQVESRPGAGSTFSIHLPVHAGGAS